ncbi:uncharacterized protein YecT (DUF1311 family) [Paraburkholderia sp. MM5496-R1]|uniref:lysozyme inhibitor LprI family protein n=1 Tax=Paraburkholderia sp. MM5496-R1 TaxID=2991065 RepID=UPI003D1E9280
MQNTQNQPIWNPSRVASLSFILTPTFGSYLQASNWRTLGQPERAAASKVWFYISLIVLVAMAVVTVLFVGKTAAGNDDIRGIINGGALLYWFIWYVASGRKQISFVKENFGKTYAKKSMAMPVLAAFACVIAYAAVVFGLLATTLSAADVNGSSIDQASSGGSSFNLASLLGGAHGLDCAAPNVKAYIVDAYGKQLVESGIPDLVWAVQDNRIKVHVDTIHEMARNNDAKNVDCAANFVIDFPKQDIERAVQGLQHVAVEHASDTLTDPTFIAPITYQLAAPSDASEQKQGPIITLTTQEDAAVDNRLKTYMADYRVLAFATPDITPTSANSTPWSKAFKDATVQGCSKSGGVERCTCQMNAVEKVVGERQMARIGYALQGAGPLSGDLLPNFKKLAAALDQQCPLTQSLASVLGDQSAADVAASAVQASAAVPGSEVAQPTTAQPQQQAQTTQPNTTTSTKAEPLPPAQSSVVASFDCGKASSRIEKLVCSSPATADADRRLALAYRAAAANASDAAALKQQQREWLKERNACDDTACLIKTTEARIQVLSAM